MKTIPTQNVNINDDFWNKRLSMNTEVAIFYQWDKLEETRNIDNFRILIGKKEGFREGFFYSDSDAYKWLDAALRIYEKNKDSKLKQIIDNFIDLIEKAQNSDGYLFTYNQIHFPEVKWKNIQIEHELYSIGHLIEAAVHHYNATGEKRLINIVKKLIQLIKTDFNEIIPQYTPGHQEIEIALLKLYKILKDPTILEMVENFLKKRGKISGFFFHMLGNAISTGNRMKIISKQKEQYIENHPDYKEFSLPGHVKVIKPKGMALRSLFLFGSGRYNQQHNSIYKQTVPEGHAVRYVYMQTANAMLCNEKNDSELLDVLEKSWDHMVQKRMFVTGGIGSIPVIEGFGYDYELDPYYAYCETCAALGSMFWSWQMTLLTKNAKYADLFEWQLYNAASVGISLDGKSYLYRNPLASDQDIDRQSWYETPCCPSNISRTWASLEEYLYSIDNNEFYIHQYIGNESEILVNGKNIDIKMVSKLPWEGKITIELNSIENLEFPIYLRIPSWTNNPIIKINGDIASKEEINQNDNLNRDKSSMVTASGYNPYTSYYAMLKRSWNNGDRIEIEFPIEVKIHFPHKKVKSLRNKFALSRGPLMFCAESIDNPNLNVLNLNLFEKSVYKMEKMQTLNDIYCLNTITEENKPVTLIPYYAWANRNLSKMNVYYNLIEN